MKKKLVMVCALAAGSLAVTGCSAGSANTQTAQESQESSAAETQDTVKTVYENTEDGGHAIEADGEEASYDQIQVTKSGDSEGDEADFYGENSAVFAQNGAKLTITNANIETDGKHANAVFSYGEGTEISISDSEIHTKGDCSGGLMTTGGAVMNAENLHIITEGNSSAAIRSDRGGGTVSVDGGYYETNGTGSPAIYSTADITVKNAELVSNASQGIVVEGKNSVTLEDVTVTANHTEQNSDKTDALQAVMLYQSMSGDADEGTAKFSMTGGQLESKSGGMFYVNNTTAEISLENAALICATDDLLRIEKAGWGREGANGGNVTFTASAQELSGVTTVDEISTLNLYLQDGSSYTGAINSEGAAGAVYVELSEDSSWTLSADSYISSLSCDADAIDLNGYALYVDGEAYAAGTASEGTAVEAYQSEDSGEEGRPGDGKPGDGQEPPAKPDGNMTPPADGETPPERPEGGQEPSDGKSDSQGESGKPEDGKEPPERPSGEMTPPADGETPPERPEGGQEPPDGKGGPQDGNGKPGDGKEPPEKPSGEESAAENTAETTAAAE